MQGSDMKRPRSSWKLMRKLHVETSCRFLKSFKTCLKRRNAKEKGVKHRKQSQSSRKVKQHRKQKNSNSNIDAMKASNETEAGAVVLH